MELLVDIIGWGAASLILLAYVLLSLGRIAANSGIYQWLNAAGAAGFILNSGYYGALPSAVLNIIWLVIALYALWMIRRRAG